MSILVVGSVAIDSVTTPFGERDNVLGGSATFFSLAASLFDKVNIVATVGEDFPKRYIDLLKRKGVGLDGFHVVPGKTFRWKGRYDSDLNVAHTIHTHLNVFQDFDPVVPKRLRGSPVVFLANIDPELQYRVLRQMRRPKFVACDSMNFWIASKRKALERLLGHVDLFLLNDGEARLLSGESNLLKAAREIVRRGPRAVVIKKGEHGALYVTRGTHFVMPAYPLGSLYDPTGAGDTFAGGMMGYLSASGRRDETAVRRAIAYGSVLASFAVEDFSVGRLVTLRKSDVRRRFDEFKKITKF